MKVANKEQAWKEANKIFPTDYEKDYAASEKAGYNIYRNPTLNYYNRICDLGDRLEVLTGEYGESVTNIWIEEPKMTIAEQVAQRTQPIISEQVHRMTFAVMGTDYTAECEKQLYNALSGERFEAFNAAGDFVVAWCKHTGFKWGSVSIASLDHYSHGNGGGHYCITALIGEHV